ncbi:basic proline-rich protein-like [Orcinus orca]|uniref:basic proline-rich protein-like n=1 Tax=Orcinus orca TaxID=9733 RepID=UPI002111AEF7|nr:basic proline-rich protein-like [Orcinus orca]
MSILGFSKFPGSDASVPRFTVRARQTDGGARQRRQRSRLRGRRRGKGAQRGRAAQPALLGALLRGRNALPNTASVPGPRPPTSDPGGPDPSPSAGDGSLPARPTRPPGRHAPSAPKLRKPPGDAARGAAGRGAASPGHGVPPRPPASGLSSRRPRPGSPPARPHSPPGQPSTRHPRRQSPAGDWEEGRGRGPAGGDPPRGAVSPPRPAPALGALLPRVRCPWRHGPLLKPAFQ